MISYARDVIEIKVYPEGLITVNETPVVLSDVAADTILEMAGGPPAKIDMYVASHARSSMTYVELIREVQGQLRRFKSALIGYHIVRTHAKH